MADRMMEIRDAVYTLNQVRHLDCGYWSYHPSWPWVLGAPSGSGILRLSVDEALSLAEEYRKPTHQELVEACAKLKRYVEGSGCRDVTPKAEPITVERAVEILNEHRHRDYGLWHIYYNGLGPAQFVYGPKSPDGLTVAFTSLEAVAIAQMCLRLATDP